MSRRKDEDKRQAIVSEAKRLFALNGYATTSMGEVAEAIGIPVGSLYTYFESKDALLETILEEGWMEFRHSLESGMTQVLERMSVALPPSAAAGDGAPPLDAGSPRPDSGLLKLSYMVRVALPRLFDDLELISILLTQYPGITRLEEKLDFLAGAIEAITMECVCAGRDSGEAPRLDTELLKPGLAVMLLGSLEVMRLAHRKRIDVTSESVISFLVKTVEAALGCSLPRFET